MTEQSSPASTDPCQQPSVHSGHPASRRDIRVQGTGCWVQGAEVGGRTHVSSVSRDQAPLCARNYVWVPALALPLSQEAGNFLNFSDLQYSHLLSGYNNNSKWIPFILDKGLFHG